MLALGPAATRGDIAMLLGKRTSAKSVGAKIRGIQDAADAGTFGPVFLTETRAKSDRAQRVSFGPGLGTVIGVAVGHEQVRGCIVDGNAARMADIEMPRCERQLLEQPDRLAQRVADAVTRVIARTVETTDLAHRGALGLHGIAIAWPAPLEGPEKVPRGPEMTGWRRGGESLIVERISRALDSRLGTRDANGNSIDWSKRVHLLNDCDAEALGEAYLFDRTSRSDRLQLETDWETLLLVYAGCGIGAALVSLAPRTSHARLPFLRSRILTGANGMAGEIAHCPVPLEAVESLSWSGEWEPIDCSCGDPDSTHLEAVVGANALAARLEMLGFDRAEGESRAAFVGRLLELPNEEVNRLVGDAGWILGTTLRASLALLDPHRLVLSGFIGTASFRAGFARAIDEKAPAGVVRSACIADALGSEALSRGCYGAAITIMRSHLWRKIDRSARHQAPSMVASETALREFQNGILRYRPTSQPAGT